MSVQSLKLALSDWDWAMFMLTQAMKGAISPNFRMVELDIEDKNWVVRVTLREESEEDRGWIAQICSDFFINLTSEFDRKVINDIVADITISNVTICPYHGHGHRIVFLAREAK